MITLLQAMSDENLFGAWFNDPNWAPWKTFLKSFFGLPLDESERSLFAECTGRVQAPTTQAQESWLVCGRRSGKSHVVALLATYLSCFKNYDAYLAPGEIGTFMIIASDKLQARNIRRYIIGLLENTPLLSPLVIRTTQEVIELSTHVNIEIHACGYRGVRGYTLIGAACDEAAFWADDSGANPSSEVIAALRPGLLSIPNAPLLCLSTPYRKTGVLWETFRRCYGREGPTLVWRAASRG